MKFTAPRDRRNEKDMAMWDQIIGGPSPLEGSESLARLIQTTIAGLAVIAAAAPVWLAALMSGAGRREAPPEEPVSLSLPLPPRPRKVVNREVDALDDDEALLLVGAGASSQSI